MTRKITTLATDKVASPPKPTTVTVLVEIHADDFVQMFGDPHIQARIINRPRASIANECRVDDLVDSILPLRFKQIRWPDRGLLKTGNIRQLTLADVKEGVEALNALDHCRWPNNRTRQLAIMEVQRNEH